MREIKKVKAANIFPIITEILEQGQNTRISVTGDSMYPFLRNGIDSVELTKGSFEQLSRGDVVMILRSDGCYIMHRIFIKKADCFFIVGDAQQSIEGPLYPNQLVAVVTAIWRKEKCISCSSRWWRLLAGLWLYLRPFRFFILKVHRKIRKIQKKLKL